MKNDTISNRNFLLSLLIGLALFLFTLFAQIPYAFTEFFATYSPLLFLLVFVLYSLIFRVKGYLGWVLGLSFTATLFALALSYMWTSGYSDNKIIGGLLPYKDAYYYYNGARLFIDGRLLPEYSVQAAGRPLFPGFLASLLILTGKNLQATIAILVGLLAFTSYLSAQKLRSHFGILASALYISFLFFYAQEQIGFLHTEILGLILGNLGLILIWNAAEKKNTSKLLFAIFILMLGVSARAGAFFIFPMLALWAGWIFRGEKRFSWKNFSLVLLVTIISYLSVNTLYARLTVEPGNHNFGNFAYTIYGQIHGGTGWNRAIRDMGTRDPEIIMDAAIDFFKAHPLSLLIGTAKAYRDFFLPEHSGIFSFDGSNKWIGNTLWGLSLILLLLALKNAIKNFKKPIHSLLLATFIGIFLSIPFLPPIDGGKRFYASTMPLFFAFIVIALPTFEKKKEAWIADKKTGVALLSGLLALMTLLPAPLIIRLSTPPEIEELTCPADQVPYALRVDPNFSINIVSSQENLGNELSSLHIDDFEKNGTQITIDPFFKEQVELAKMQEGRTRIFTANNLVINGRFHFFVTPAELLEKVPPRTLVSGCATELVLIEMKSRPILYKIESMIIP
ncbi:MAG: hypothetical protein GY755_05230 [Chloroflexi bacterium]|nr:hypothetical protein [Chloroflexota bacterium]